MSFDHIMGTGQTPQAAMNDLWGRIKAGGWQVVEMEAAPRRVVVKRKTHYEISARTVDPDMSIVVVEKK